MPPYEFKSVFDGTHSFMEPRHKNQEAVLSRQMAEKLRSLKTNPWKYVGELEYFYQYRELLPEVYASCKSYLEEDMKQGGQWFLNIPYPGIQWLLFRYVDSIETLESFLALTVRTDQ